MKHIFHLIFILFCNSVFSQQAANNNSKVDSLEKIINRHNIDTKDRHRAYADAKAILDFTKLAIYEKGIDAFRESAAKQAAF